MLKRLTAAQLIRLTHLSRWVSGVFVSAYFGAFLFAQLPIGEEFSQFMGPRILFFVYLPVMLCLVYFFARVNLGRWLLERGAVEEAIAWCEPRIGYHFWLRGKRESLVQRMVLARAWMMRGEEGRASALLWPAERIVLPSAGSPELLELAVWRAEVSLCVGDLARTREAIGAGTSIKKPALWRASLLAAQSELALREGDVARAVELCERARWVDARAAHVLLVGALVSAARAAELTKAERERALEELDACRAAVLSVLPWRSAQLDLASAALREGARVESRRGGE